MARLDGKIALVTGAGHGIGQAIARAFAREGADVAVNDLSSDRLEATVEAIRSIGARAWALPGDVSDEPTVRGMMERFFAETGRLDVVVANAGIAERTPIAEMSVEQWDRMVAVHLRGTFLTIRYAIPSMIAARSGKVITIGSQLGQIGRPGWGHYAAAKGGIIALTKTLARELGPVGINVNCIAPGPISTGLAPGDPEEEERLRMLLPLRRFGDVDDVAPTAVFLASAESDYYTGQTLGPNGGDVML